MNKLNLKPTSKPITTYYTDIAQKRQLGLWTEGNVAPIFATLLEYCVKTVGYSLNQQHTTKIGKRTLRFDGAILNQFNLPYGVWEAKDSADSLPKEIQKKFADGYPNRNTLFQSPDEAILYQNGKVVMTADLTKPQDLIDILNAFFSYTDPVYDQWEQAVAEFKTRVPQIAQKLDDIIEKEYQKRRDYTRAFDTFHDLCRVAINPNLSKDAVEEMLIQHILTERIFRKVFNNDKFTSQNIIAKEIEKVVDALTRSAWNREDFLGDLNHFYGAIETTASTISDYNEKQAFLNTVYEQFFQGFSVAVADTHGIVYTPQPIVQFMVKSVEQLLKREFGRSLADSGVHILDPFVGTGNFLLRVIEEIRQMNPAALPHKYAHELHCNEIMLLPYYIASMNIEHAYYEAMGEYEPFEGICLVDTFELAEARQLGLFTQENLARVERQRASPLTVIIGNPPYNVGQVNQNDNNKNRKYPVIDKRVQETYAKASTATNRNVLSDPYVKAFRWASDRLKDEGVIAFVTNNSFIDNIAFDGMRHHFEQEFSAIYHINFKGNARTSGERRKREGGNLFNDLIRVSVGITFLVKRKDHVPPAQIFIYSVDDYLHADAKLAVVDGKTLNDTPIKLIQPDRNHVWLTEGMMGDFGTLMPIGTKDAKRGKGQAIFNTYTIGVQSNRDSWVYNFDQPILTDNVKRMIDVYNEHVFRYSRLTPKPDIDSFVTYDDKKISWSRDLKADVRRGRFTDFDPTKIRRSIYRPFTKKHLYFDPILNQEISQNPRFFPTPQSENENRVICTVTEQQIPFSAQIINCIPAYHYGGRQTQCFPLYVYDTDGTNRRDNISDWALKEYQTHYNDPTITKSDIFYHIYALLHHPVYRERYAQNLKRELPRVPFVSAPLPQTTDTSPPPNPLPKDWRGGTETGESPFPHSMGEGLGMGDKSTPPNSMTEGLGMGDKSPFHTLAKLGRDLSYWHLNYEQEAEYPLEHLQNPKVPPSLRVEVMRLNKDKTELVVNESLTLRGIPSRVFEYKLGNRSALEWVIDQYRVTTDKRSGIINDPNRADDAGYIVRLVKQVVHVSLETLRIVDEIGKVTF